MSATLREFNPSGNPHVDEIKRRTDELITYIKEIGENEADPRCKSIALTNYEQAAMWAVKSLFVGVPSRFGDDR